MAYLEAAGAEPGGEVTVELERATAKATIVGLPFYKR
jgi:hypothetical protein